VISWVSVNTRGVTGLNSFIVSYRQNILIGRVYPDGSSSEPITANYTWEGAQKGPSIINIGSGELLVSWMGRVGDPETSIMTQRFSVGASPILASTSSVDSFFSTPLIEDSLLESSDPLKKKRAGLR
jgi:hypothetical protein